MLLSLRSCYRVALLVALAASFTVGAAGCSSKKKASAVAPDAATSAAPDAAAPTEKEPATPPWDRTLTESPLGCGEPLEVEDSYAQALARGRKALAEKRLPEAVSAFERAMVVKQTDPVALSELSAALLQLGESQVALEVGRRAVTVATEPKLKAASLYNVGRAAENLGDLAAAKARYEESLALRDHAPLRERLAKLAAPPLRPLGRAPGLTVCKNQPSVAAVCACLGQTPAIGGGTASKPVECKPAPEQPGKAGQLVIVSGPASSTAGDPAAGDPSDDDSNVVPATAIVLVVQQGATWSALALVESSDSVDLDETPRTTRSSSILHYEELPYRGGTLFWVHTESGEEDVVAGDTFSDGSGGLTLCLVPHPGSTAAPSCTPRLVTSEWDYILKPVITNDSEALPDECEVKRATRYRISLESTGVLSVALAAGADAKGFIGRYSL